MNVLVTGGAGYIGSHTCVVLLLAGHRVTVLDNLVNSSAVALERVHVLVPAGELRLIIGDVRDRGLLDGLFAAERFDAVIHFAGLKAVGESTARPLDYYENNVGGTLTLCQAMARAGLMNLVFSSSATVYGDPRDLPIREDAPLCATNPYGWSKLMASMRSTIRDRKSVV